MSVFQRVIRSLLKLVGGAREPSEASEDVTLTYIRHDDPEMVAAWEEARATVGEFAALLQDASLADADFYVKKKFDDGERSEHIWLNDVAVDQGQFVGYVGNEPGVVQGVTYDDEARVSPDEISDWMVMRDGEILHGGYTVELLMKRRRKI